MRARLLSMLATALVVTLGFILYEAELISYLAQRISKTIKVEPSKTFFFVDLSNEFESSKHMVASLDVMEALKRDDYSPICVSVTSMTRSAELDLPMSKRYNLTENNKTNSVVGVKSNHSASSNSSLSQDIASGNYSKSTNKSQFQSGNENNKSETNDSITKSEPEPGGNHFDSLRIANETLQPVLKVPNVVHYVFLGTDLDFTFINYLSYRSVDRFIRPDQIFVHGDHIPSGKWWNRTINEVQNIYHVNRTYSIKAPNGQPYKYPAHISDYMRTETLLKYGGIYLDADVVVVKSFNELRKFSFVIGREAENALCNGIMVAERGAPFLRLLLEQYHSYLGAKEIWAEKSVFNADTLARLYPHLVHVEDTTLNRPSWKEKVQIYDGMYNWKQNYAVHLWIRTWPEEKRPNGVEDILTKNTTFAEIARLTIFGSHEIRKN